MTRAWDALNEALWAKLRELSERRTTYVGRIEQAVASNPTAPGGPARGRVLVSGIDKDRSVPVHPTMALDEQIRGLGNAAVGLDVLVLSIDGQLYGASIQLTGETRW